MDEAFHSLLGESSLHFSSISFYYVIKWFASGSSASTPAADYFLHAYIKKKGTHIYSITVKIMLRAPTSPFLEKTKQNRNNPEQKKNTQPTAPILLTEGKHCSASSWLPTPRTRRAGALCCLVTGTKYIIYSLHDISL